MSQIVTEYKESRSLNRQGGRFTGTQVFHVYDDTTPIEYASEIQFGSNGLPQFGDTMAGETELFATSFSADPVPESRGVWRVTWTFQTGDGSPIDQNPAQIGYVQFSMDYGGQFKDVYRTNPGLNLQGGAPTGADIRGRAVDAAGVPTSVFVPQHRLIVEETVAATTLVARTSVVRQLVGVRNNANFYGADSGTLLYEGADARRSSLSTYTLTHRFLYDEWYHMGQQPRMNSQGQPELEIGVQPFAAWVRWIQPFPLVGSFNQISENF